jgi:membrane protease YdiL (CAAX protease family)
MRPDAEPTFAAPAVTPESSESQSAVEILIALALFACACAAFIGLAPPAGSIGTRAGSVATFVLLAGSYTALSVRAVRLRLRALAPRARLARTVAGPAVLLAASAFQLTVAGLLTPARVAGFAVYLLLPALLVALRDTPPGRVPIHELAAAFVLGLPIKFHLLPRLPLGAGSGYDAGKLVALVAGMYLFLVARPLEGIGYTYALRRRDVAPALAAFFSFAVIAIPLGLGTRFLAFNPQPGVVNVVATPVVIYLVTAVPEEFLFRGLIQNLLGRWLGPRAALAIASVVFGLSHLPDPRYALLATLAGVAYGWVYLRTGRITASAVTHALVDAVWVVVLRA